MVDQFPFRPRWKMLPTVGYHHLATMVASLLRQVANCNQGEGGDLRIISPADRGEHLTLLLDLLALPLPLLL